MATNQKVKDLDKVVIRFSGDSGDGMQVVGNIFSNLSAMLGSEISTFPDYPAEMRAPQGTLGGVSGFQVHLGKGVFTPGDKPDVLVAMNPAALKVNAKVLKPHSVLIVDEDSFTESDLKKANFATNDPYTELGIKQVQLVSIPITTLCKESLKESGLDNKAIVRCKNMFALGFCCWLFNMPVDNAVPLLQVKFKKKPAILQAIVKVLGDGFNYGSNIHATVSTYNVETPDSMEPGIYTDVNGNAATAFGLVAAAERAGLPLFLGSYPITPATEILQELTARKELGIKAMQCEDEIAGICTAIGAAFTGSLAVTNTSGPGLALKSEAIGLAVMAELPLVVIDVQRGGPSTGLPTKTEQADLMQALYGRNGESPLVVLSASSPIDCFDMAYNAAKIALESMTPVVLLTDGFVANGSQAWRIPDVESYPEIHPPFVTEEMKEEWKPYKRDAETLVRYWAVPGQEGFAHRLGGLEKDYNTSAISTDAANHQKMVDTRRDKVRNIAQNIPEQEVLGNPDADTLVVGWGGTFGHLYSAVSALNANGGTPVALAHFNYINPLPKNTEAILSKYKRVLVCEINGGQFVSYLRSEFPSVKMEQYNKVQGQPFMVSELVEVISRI